MNERLVCAFHSGKQLFLDIVRDESHKVKDAPKAKEAPQVVEVPKVNGVEFLPNVTIGAHTYGYTEATFINPFNSSEISIGKYCSIAQGVKILSASARHSLDFVSTYPIKGTPVPGAVKVRKPDKADRGTRIGNDVWLGLESLVMPCVKIGNGAVIGARAVVTSDVPAYAIVAGSPAKIVRYRCTPEQIAQLERIAWWDWSDEKIEQCGNDFYMSVDDFIKKHAGK